MGETGNKPLSTWRAKIWGWNQEWLGGAERDQLQFIKRGTILGTESNSHKGFKV